MEKSERGSSFDNPKQVLSQALQAVQLGRDCLLSYYGRIRQIEFKEKAGLVSEADRESERIIQQALHRFDPNIDFLGEESSYFNPQIPLVSTGRPRWILDPLDGTTNFIHQLPIWCISLALEINNEVVLGIIDVPILNQTFTAIKGEGAFCNGQKIHVSKTPGLSDAFMTTGFVNEDENVLKEQLQIFNHFVWQARGIRRPGAAAYDLAMVASGVFDLYWEKNIKPWDVAAGLLLVQEAGGVVTTYSGEKYNPYLKSIVAANQTLSDVFLKDLSKVISV